MLSNDKRRKIENIVAGIIIEGESDYCTAIRNLLCAGFPTSTTVKTEFESKAIIKEKQAILLENYCSENNIWLNNFPEEENYLTHGGEAKVYLNTDHRTVIKLNDAVYYATWLEFFNSIILDNLIFKNTSYNFLGFTKQGSELYAVLKQPFIISDAQADLKDIKSFLTFNGFENNRRNDYIHKELGLILEDMHDENVIVNSDTLFFIDTVFYTVTPEQPT